MRRTSGTRPARLLPVALAVALLLAGCAPAPDLGRDTAESLQDGVLAVTTASASGDFQSAADSLRATMEQLESAAAERTVSPERYRQIRAALAQVETDLQNAITAAELQRIKDDLAEQAEAQAALDKAALDQAAADQTARDQAAADQAAADQAAADEAAADQDDAPPASGGGPGNSDDKTDKGKGNEDKGNGKKK